MKINFNFLISCIVFLFCNAIYSQILPSDKKVVYKTIAFGEKIDFGLIDAATTWKVKNSSESKIVNLTANQINDFVFDKSGQYQITYSDNKPHSSDSCHDDLFPHNMTIVVSAIKMTYDFSKINFSQNLQLGNNSDIVISVPIIIESKNNKVLKSNSEKLVIAGIGCDLVAYPLQKEIDLKTGNQLLKFSVSGTISKPTYLMFDFIDCNNQVQTYNLPQIIK